MLNLQGSGEDHAPDALQRRVRRRPLSGDRVHGWADVHKLDGNDIKYHVQLNTTAHLDWEEWQRMCAAESTEQHEPVWCILSATDASDKEEEDRPREDGRARTSNTGDGNSLDATAREPTGIRRVESQSMFTEAVRFVRRSSESPDRAADPAPPATGATL